MTEETEVVQEQSQDQQPIETVQEVKTPEVSRNEAEHNWREANRVLKEQKQLIDELQSKIASNTPVKNEELDDIQEAFKALGVDKEDYLTAEKAMQLADRIADKKAEKKSRQVVQEYIQQQHIVQDEQRMRDKHEDFDYVIENFALPMIKNDPALAYRIQNSKNPAETAYKLAKISDEYEDNKVKQPNSAKAEKILKNSSRPVSSNAVGTPLRNQAEDFSKMSQQDIWAMSQKYARGA